MTITDLGWKQRDIHNTESGNFLSDKSVSFAGQWYCFIQNPDGTRQLRRYWSYDSK